MILAALFSMFTNLSAEDLTPQQLSLLQTAVSAEHLHQQLTEGFHHCQNSTSSEQWLSMYTDLGSYQLTDLIEQTLSLPADSFQEFSRALSIKPSRNAERWQAMDLACDDSDSWQQLFRDYREAYFFLELSPPLKPSFADTMSQIQQDSGLQQQQYQELIDNSNSIAIATVVNKNQLSAIEQANYLHIDYRSDYIFRIQSGWKNYPPLFLGMHSYLSANEITNNNEQWLIFLDVQQRFIKAIPLSEAVSYLDLLGTENWSFDRHGNLNRNP